ESAVGVLDEAGAARARDVERRIAAHRRSARVWNDFRRRARLRGLAHRADAQRSRASSTARRLRAYVPGGRRRGRLAWQRTRAHARRRARPRAWRVGPQPDFSPVAVVSGTTATRLKPGCSSDRIHTLTATCFFREAAMVCT